MKQIHLESKQSQEVTDKFNEINPDVWKAYTTIDPETFEIVYCVDCYVKKMDAE